MNRCACSHASPLEHFGYVTSRIFTKPTFNYPLSTVKREHTPREKIIHSSCENRSMSYRHRDTFTSTGSGSGGFGVSSLDNPFSQWAKSGPGKVRLYNPDTGEFIGHEYDEWVVVQLGFEIVPTSNHYPRVIIKCPPSVQTGTPTLPPCPVCSLASCGLNISHQVQATHT